MFWRTDAATKALAPLRSAPDWRLEALGLGLALAAAGPLPIVLANREVVFPGLSRYNLVASIGVVMALVAFTYWLASARVRRAVLAALLAIGVLTQFATGAARAQQSAALDQFWWQVSWRIPQLAKDTTLLVNYPGANLDEKYFVWSPANLIYYPNRQSLGEFLQPALFSALPTDETLRKILTDAGEEFENRRLILTYTSYSNLLVISQPSSVSCVQVLDAQNPEFSAHESGAFVAAAAYSNASLIFTETNVHNPPAAVFGAEPVRGWCYFYEKASLARQRGELAEVLELGEQALAAGLRAGDAIEWLPFLQAFAHAGLVDQIELISSFIDRDETFVRAQICTSLSQLGGVNEDTRAVVIRQFCN
jgi:hypothetical protein